MADLYARYNCCYCQEEISGTRVKCGECPDFDICLQCFSVGAEIGNHKNDHSYQFMDSGSMGMWSRNGWSAKEEVRLLDAIEQFGFGNWEDIAKHIETRTPEEAKDEYITRYLEGAVGRATWSTVEQSSRPNLQCVAKDDGPLAPAALSRLPTLATTNEEASQLGYMPNRDDFEREHDHEAEQIISTLSLNSDDDDLDIALKLSQVDVYTRKLRERTRRKRLVRDYQLVSVFFNNIKNKQKILGKLAKDKKEFTDGLRWLAGFMSRSEHSSCVRSLWRERELRLRLAELHRYRLAGLTRLEETQHYDQHAVRRHHVRRNIQHLAGSSGCQANNQNEPMQQQQNNAQQLKRRDGENVSSSTSPRSTRDGNTACGCSRKHSCNKQLLSSSEAQLCNTLNLPATQYITIKTLILRGGSESEIEYDHAIRTYLAHAGWLTGL